MLQCTPAAADTLRAVREQQGIPHDFGLRLSAAPIEGGGVALQLGFTEEPRPGDQVAEDNGQRLFVAEEVADGLSGMALDVVNPPTQDGSQPPELVLRPADTGT